MTTATSTRGQTEFLVSQGTSSKELFEQLSKLTAGKGSNADLPIRAYDEGRKVITLKIYNKKSSARGIIKASLNPEKVPARLLVITTIEKILKSESKKSSGAEKKTIDQVWGNIKAKKSNCIKHDIKIPDLIADLSELKSIWDKSETTVKTAVTLSPSSATPPRKTEPHKEIKKGKSILAKDTEKTKSQAKANINPTQTKNRASVSAIKKPHLKIQQADFDLSSAINILSQIKKYGEKFDLESNAKARIRVGEIKNTGELSFYVSTKAIGKTKKKDRLEEGRKAENKTTTTNRAITMLRAIAKSLVDQNRLSATEENKVFSTIEDKGYISINDASALLVLLETGRRAVYEMPPLVQANVNGTSDSPSIPNINTNPFDENPIEENSHTSALPSSKAISNHSFENVSIQTNNVAIAPSPIKTESPTTVQIKRVEHSTNPFDDSPAVEPQTPTPAPPTFFQTITDFFKPVTNFFTWVRGLFGIN